MEQIRDSRRNIVIHPDVTEDDLPVTGLDGLPPVANTESFVPQGMDKPQVYAGDVVIGVQNGRIQFGELVHQKINDGVLIVPLDTGKCELVPDGEFSSRFYKADEIHIYDGVADAMSDWDVEFDESAVERPEQGRAR
jgi:hypothetical protein